jgi:hypothetical protein
MSVTLKGEGECSSFGSSRAAGPMQCWPRPAAVNRAAACLDWLAAEIQEAIDDFRPNVSHEEVMAEMEADIATLAKPDKSARA